MKEAQASPRNTVKQEKRDPLSSIGPDLRARLRQSLLYTYGLIDDRTLITPLTEESRIFLQNMAQTLNTEVAVGASYPVLTKRGIVTKNSFLHQVTAPANVDVFILARMLGPNKHLADTMNYLIDNNILTPVTLWQQFVTKRDTFFKRALKQRNFDWRTHVKSGVVMKGGVNVINQGLDTVEPEALQADLTGTSEKSERYPLDSTAHPVVQKLRGQEHIEEISEQFTRVLDRDPSTNIMDSFRKVFDAYLTTTQQYKQISKRDKIPLATRERERAVNIYAVNDKQLRLLDKSDSYYFRHESAIVKEPTKRYLDIYARYDGCGLMDPLQLAIISCAAWWYVIGGRSKLFNGVRIVPYKAEGNKTRIPYVALAAAPGSKLLDVQGDDFKLSMIGSNRMFLTHSNAREASEFGSIPIVDLATYKNSSKIPSKRSEYVVLGADFDPKDRHRGVDRTFASGNKVPHRNRAGDIAALINETLRAIEECEQKEIARAKR